MGSVSKLQARGIDRVSALPDPVLCHILSFIPTIDSVKTTILSRRWKNLWTFVPNLDLDDGDYCDTIWFSRYVDRVLFFRDSADIHTFHLHSYSIEDFSRIDGWIATALKRNVVELDLCVESNEERMYELPKILLLCKTLMDLRLRSNFIINPPTSACLPSLKSLYVDIVHPNNNSMEKLFSSLPVLEHLHINVSEPELLPGGDAATNLTISHPELKTLRLNWFETHGDYEKCSLFIATPKLEQLDLSQCVLIHSFLEDANSLVRADISFFHHSGNEGHRFTIRATALLAGLSNVKYLSLSSHNLKGCCPPVFDNLRKLDLFLHFCYHWKLTTEMLKRSRNLEYLALILCGYLCVKSSERQWNPPENVPPCLLSHLKTISIMGFQGKLDEMEAAKYFLKNGKVMKKMTIQTHNLPCTKEELHKELMFQRASKACQVEII